MIMKRLYFESMWIWCRFCFVAYRALPCASSHQSRWGRFQMWLLGYAGAYAHSTKADFYLCSFFYRTKEDQSAAWDDFIARQL